MTEPIIIIIIIMLSVVIALWLMTIIFEDIIKQNVKKHIDSMSNDNDTTTAGTVLTVWNVAY